MNLPYLRNIYRYLGLEIPSNEIIEQEYKAIRQYTLPKQPLNMRLLAVHIRETSVKVR